MTETDIAKYYNRLTNGDKGRFVAYLCLKLGGSPHTWQQKILGWMHNEIGRTMTPPVERELSAIIKEGSWKVAR